MRCYSLWGFASLFADNGSEAGGWRSTGKVLLWCGLLRGKIWNSVVKTGNALQRHWQQSLVGCKLHHCSHLIGDVSGSQSNSGSIVKYDCDGSGSAKRQTAIWFYMFVCWVAQDIDQMVSLEGCSMACRCPGLEIHIPAADKTVKLLFDDTYCSFETLTFSIHWKKTIQTWFWNEGQHQMERWFWSM